MAMKLWVLKLFFVGIGLFGHAQDCPDLTDPLNGAVNISVDATISWVAVEGVTGYVISLGTFPGGTDIVNEQPTGSSNSYTPALGLPDNTTIYVTITLFYFNLPDIVCPSQSFQTEDITVAPLCTMISNPSNGALDVNIASNINWNYSTGATGYVITVGTAPGLGDILNSTDVGNVLTYNPASDLPSETVIFVEVIPYNENGSSGSCQEESFTTGAIAALPVCASIIDPVDGAINVPLSPFIQWEAIAGALGYKVYIGRTPFENDILDGGVFNTNSTFVINFESNNVYFIRIVPFNAAGDAIGCGQSSFSTILGCGPFLNPLTGELDHLNPELTFPDVVGICLDNIPTTISATDVADGFRWYAFNDQGDPLLISSEAEVLIDTIGSYRYEAYILSEQAGIQVECSSYKDFMVVSSERATIDGVNVTDGVSSFDLEVIVSGSGDYEYSVISSNGPYQASNVFNDVAEETSTIFVRDRNGCGIAEYNIESLVIKKGFPTFFTPNNDGFNDYWQYVPKEDDNFQLEVIYIYDRFGKLMKSLNPQSQGWTGDFDGYELPNSDYWFLAVTTDGNDIRGHFSLRR